MDIEDLYSEIRRQVRGCPEDSMRDALVRAAQEFCYETWILRRQQQFTTVQAQQQYPVAPPPNEEVLALKHAQITLPPPNSNTAPLRFVYPSMVNPNIGQQRPWGICFVPYDTIALVPPPDQAYTVLVELITQPVTGTMYIPDELGRTWVRALGYGALQWLYTTNPTDPWYSESKAGSMRLLFNQEIVKARGAAAFDFTPNQRRLIGGNFAGIR